MTSILQAGVSPAMGLPVKIEITIDGVEYVGYYTPISYKKGDAEIDSYTSLVLSPENKEKPKYSVSIGFGEGKDPEVGFVRLGDKKFPVPHRSVCIIAKEATFMKTFVEEVPMDAYATRDKLTKAIESIVKRAEQGAAPNP